MDTLLACVQNLADVLVISSEQRKLRPELLPRDESQLDEEAAAASEPLEMANAPQRPKRARNRTSPQPTLHRTPQPYTRRQYSSSRNVRRSERTRYVPDRSDFVDPDQIEELGDEPKSPNTTNSNGGTASGSGGFSRYPTRSIAVGPQAITVRPQSSPSTASVTRGAGRTILFGIFLLQSSLI